MCSRYYIGSGMTDEVEKIVHEIDRQFQPESFHGDIRSTNLAYGGILRQTPVMLKREAEYEQQTLFM